MQADSTTPSLVCKHCGRFFTRRQPKDAKYCSRDCYHAASYGPRKGLADQLWSKVEKTDTCWIFRRSLNHAGYGQIHSSIRKRPLLAHRVAYELTHGPIPDGLFVCHKCDNPPCCNPDHLFLGTPADNREDQRQKDRIPYGVQHQNAVLSDDDVITILELGARRVPQQEIAHQFGVTQSLVSRLLSGQRRRRITGENRA